jgi:DNA-binding transcriptional LysR family regulator
MLVACVSIHYLPTSTPVASGRFGGCRTRSARGRHASGPIGTRSVRRLSAIANGYGIAFPPESSARFYARPGTVYRGVCGISASQVGIAWAAAADEDPLVQEFVNCYAAAFGEERCTAKT